MEQGENDCYLTSNADMLLKDGRYDSNKKDFCSYLPHHCTSTKQPNIPLGQAGASLLPSCMTTSAEIDPSIFVVIKSWGYGERDHSITHKSAILVPENDVFFLVIQKAGWWENQKAAPPSGNLVRCPGSVAFCRKTCRSNSRGFASI